MSKQTICRTDHFRGWKAQGFSCRQHHPILTYSNRKAQLPSRDPKKLSHAGPAQSQGEVSPFGEISQYLHILYTYIYIYLNIYIYIIIKIYMCVWITLYHCRSISLWFVYISCSILATSAPSLASLHPRQVDRSSVAPFASGSALLLLGAAGEWPGTLDTESPVRVRNRAEKCWKRSLKRKLSTCPKKTQSENFFLYLLGGPSHVDRRFFEPSGPNGSETHDIEDANQEAQEPEIAGQRGICQNVRPKTWGVQRNLMTFRPILSSAKSGSPHSTDCWEQKRWKTDTCRHVMPGWSPFHRCSLSFLVVCPQKKNITSPALPCSCVLDHGRPVSRGRREWATNSHRRAWCDQGWSTVSDRKCPSSCRWISWDVHPKTIQFWLWWSWWIKSYDVLHANNISAHSNEPTSWDGCINPTISHHMIGNTVPI